MVFRNVSKVENYLLLACHHVKARRVCASPGERVCVSPSLGVQGAALVLWDCLYKGLVNRPPPFRLSYCPPSLPLYWFLLLLPLLNGTLGEREGKRESQRIDEGKAAQILWLSKESGIKILNSRTLCIERISRKIFTNVTSLHSV